MLFTSQNTTHNTMCSHSLKTPKIQIPLPENIHCSSKVPENTPTFNLSHFRIEMRLVPEMQYVLIPENTANANHIYVR